MRQGVRKADETQNQYEDRSGSRGKFDIMASEEMQHHLFLRWKRAEDCRSGGAGRYGMLRMANEAIRSDQAAGGQGGKASGSSDAAGDPAVTAA